MSGREIVDDLNQLLDVLPPHLREALSVEDGREGLLEIILDLGRLPEARYVNNIVHLSQQPVTHDDLEYVGSRVGEFGEDNRAGIPATLHRISAILNRRKQAVGLTCRIGRAVYGTIDIIRDIVETGKSILLLGRPGIGKTTKLREVARVLADEFGKRVVIVDTSNEIAGDGDVPHPAIGRARRMQVRRPELQHSVMIEAVENHMPEVIVIDEIGTEAEAFAARTIAERGVQLIGTAHGNTLDNLIMNPTLSDLVGGVQAVILSDEEAARRRTQKTVLERKSPPSFDTVVEIMEIDQLAIHFDMAETVDAFLRGERISPEIRLRKPDGSVEVVSSQQVGYGWEQKEKAPMGPEMAKVGRPLRIFPYGVNRSKLEKAIVELGVGAKIVRNSDEADLVLALKAHHRKQKTKLKEAERRARLHVLRANTLHQILLALREVFRVKQRTPEDIALNAAEQAIRQVLDTSQAVELPPVSAPLRRLQHRLADQYGLTTQSTGVDPKRRVKVLPK
ncbi:MAG: AAA family ATPase [Armatimonadetes bacterium]|nr:AAA family ATPase [Armatimonadota bacterium]NIM23173.1 AAA family ATPase [Armatimonadota bacterium]NIM67041.1 AAA family ATPase [Armatimonadota bacterium]NIM75575.1 AAA family ATPase [Armatimonadota bacterium]NIN05230.1 AAA family ATPase [Armatimonadota bacterium]